MSNQIMAISDLGEALMILGLAAREMFLNSSIWLMKSVTLLLVGHLLKRACDILDIAIEEFICAKEGGYREVTIPQAGIRRDIGTV